MIQEDENGLMVKRIRAVGGEVIYSSRKMMDIPIPADHVFLVGDNQFLSIDSFTFGPIHRDMGNRDRHSSQV